jgi:anhydro-N-acetylmuramic acid kinase
VLNLGGIANLTWLPRIGSVLGFDSGPGNCLLDGWAQRHLGAPLDAGGAWAAGGHVIGALLAQMLKEPYLAAPPPKSTGRDLFNDSWLQRSLRGGEEARDVQATLLEFTARSVVDAGARHCGGGFRRMIVCGGGAQNAALMARLVALAAPATVESSAQHGIDPQWVEALAFAWLARRTLEGQPGNLASVTGARGPRVLGAIHPA